MPRVSVILPARNAAATLAAAVRSIRAQTFSDWELILIENGSTDDTPALAEKLASQDSRIRWLSLDEPGLTRALMAGIELAQGEVIARMDADDIALPDRLAEQVAFLDAHPEIGLVGCQVRYGGDPVQQHGYALYVEWINTLVDPAAIALNRFIESPFAHPSVCFRRTLIEQCGGYRDGPFPEDYELWLRWIDAGVRMAKVPKPLLIWNDPPQRLSRTDARYHADAFYRIKAGYLARAVERIRAGRAVWVWGAGRTTRKRAEALTAHNLRIAGYIDVDPKKIGQRIHGRPVRSPRDMPGPKEAVVLGYVASRGAREDIRHELTSRGFREGQDFWMAA